MNEVGLAFLTVFAIIFFTALITGAFRDFFNSISIKIRGKDKKEVEWLSSTVDILRRDFRELEELNLELSEEILNLKEMNRRFSKNDKVVLKDLFVASCIGIKNYNKEPLLVINYSSGTMANLYYNGNIYQVDETSLEWFTPTNKVEELVELEYDFQKVDGIPIGHPCEELVGRLMSEKLLTTSEISRNGSQTTTRFHIIAKRFDNE